MAIVVRWYAALEHLSFCFFVENDFDLSRTVHHLYMLLVFHAFGFVFFVDDVALLGADGLVKRDHRFAFVLDRDVERLHGTHDAQNETRRQQNFKSSLQATR